VIGNVSVIPRRLTISGKAAFNPEEVFYPKTGPRGRWRSRRVNELRSESGRALSGRKTACFPGKFRRQENTAAAGNQLEREGLKSA
jgi:hypothetical protein